MTPEQFMFGICVLLFISGFFLDVFRFVRGTAMPPPPVEEIELTPEEFDFVKMAERIIGERFAKSAVDIIQRRKNQNF